MAKVTNAPALSDPRKRWLRPNTSQYQQSSYARTYNPQGQQYSQGYTPPDNYAGTPFEGDDGTPYRPAGNDQWEAENQPVSYAENPEWDYQNPPVGADGRPLGMNNQPLPEGAQGWTPFGEPDWGPGFNGWWKGALYDIYDNPEKAVIKDLDYWQAQKDFWGNLAQGKPLEAIQVSFGFWQDAAQNLNSLGAEKQYDAAGNLLESRPTMLTYLSRAIGETIQGAGQLADVAAQTVESGLGTVAGTLQDLGEGSPIPEDLFSADYDKLKEIGLQAESGEWRLPNPFTLGKKSWDLGWVQTLGSMTFGVPYNAVRALTAPQKSWDEVKDTFQENWQASRIAYSALNDEALKQEFISRYKAGEDPRLLAMELGQPWQELAGKFVADPLNLLGGSAKKGADMLDNAADVFKPAPEIQAVMDGIRNAPEMGDAASTRKLQDLVTGAMQATENRLTDLAKNVQVFGSTATSKRANTLKRVGLTLDNIIGASTRADGTLDAEKTLEQIQNLVQLTSRNADEVTQALGTVLGGARKGAYDAGALLSTAGQETGLVLRRLLQDEEGVVDVGKFIDSLTEARASGSAAVAELVNKKLAPALEEMFPTTLERVSALEDLKAVEAGKKTVEADELARLQRLASLGNPGPLAPFFARVHQSSRPFYNAVNGFLSGVYMGMSPGYAFRNAIGNNFQTFVDLGIGAWKKFNPDEMAELGFKWGDEFRANRALGGISSSAAAEGITGLRNPVEAKGFIQGMMEALKGGDDLNLFEKYGQSMLRLGEYFEQNAAKRIAGYAIDRAMTALTPKAVPVAELTRIAGLTDSQARTFQQLLLRYNGDLEAAFKGLRATENVSLKAVLLNGVNADDIQILKDYDIWNDFVKSLDDVGSRDHLFNTMDEAVTQLQEVAKGVKSEHVAAGDDEFAKVIQGAEGITDNAKALNTNKYTANSHAWKAYRDATNTVFEEAYKTRLNAGQPIDDLVALRDEYKDWFTGVREASTMEQGTQFRESFIAAMSELDGKRPDLTALWKRIGLPGEPPANLARKEFRAAAWDYYFGTQNERWISYRDEVVVQLETLVKRLGEANPGLNTKPMENARKLWQEARALDDAVMAKSGGLDVMKPIQGWVNDSITKGNTQNAIRYLAQRYGIGQPNAKLSKYYDTYIAAVLKKYGGVTDPATATLEQAWRAFEARLATKQKLPQIENLTAWLGKYGETVPGKTAVEQAANVIRAPEIQVQQMSSQELTNEITTLENTIQDVARKTPPRKFTLENWKKTRQTKISAEEVIAPEITAAKERLARAQLEQELLSRGESEARNMIADKYPASFSVDPWKEGDKILSTSQGEYKLVGSGGFKYVYTNPDSDFVIKVSKIPDPLDEAVLMDKYAGTGLFPKIREVGQNIGNLKDTFYYVVADKVETFSKAQADDVLRQLTEVDATQGALAVEFKKFLREISELLGTGDFKNLENWGRTKDGKLVVLDAMDWKAVARRREIEKEIKLAAAAASENEIVRAGEGLISSESAQDYASVQDAIDDLLRRRNILAPYSKADDPILARLDNAIERLKALMGTDDADVSVISRGRRAASQQAQISYVKMRRPLPESPSKTAAEQVAELIRPATEAKIGERVYTNQIENTWEVGTVESVTGDGRIVIRTDNPVMGAETVSASRYIPASEVKKPVASFKYAVPSEAKKAVTETILDPPASPGVASLPRTLKESLPGLTQYLDELKVKLDQNWGNYVGGALTKEQELSLSNYLKTVASPKMQEARRLAGAVAEAQRKFTILDYADRTNFDLALSMVMPYHFWYSRTYGNWMKRFMQNPKLLADYARYRETLEQIHADAPEWWRYNINTNELLGVDMKNPWYFNLEATLNPLNGLTGVDFSDPAKRVNWWTRTLDDVSKFGPSVWTPFTLATAYALYNMGEKDAAARWGGRLFPQTATLKAIGSLANVNLPFAGPHNEYDPVVNFFSGGLGLDPYEQRRVSRALGTLAQQGVITDEQAIDAAWAQSGDLYDQAVEYALDQRAIPQLQSFFMGVGFKGRTQTDIQIDQMYEQYYSLWNMAPNLSPDEFRQQMELMRTQYPWMDAVILAKKSGPERDRALAYNVLSRVPPGQSGDILALFNLSDEQMQQFYANKGDLSYMTAPDRARFMAGIAELGAALSLPTDATRMEWTEVRARYGAVQDAGAAQFGEDVWDRMSDFFAMQRANPEAAKLMLAQNPRIQAALDWREQAVMADPLLFDYYGGLDFLEKFWQGEMYDAARKQFGETIFETSMQYGALADQEAELLQQYYDLKDAGQDAEAKAFRAAWLDKDSNQKDLYLAAHPELKAYWDLKKAYQEEIARKLVEFEPKLRDVSPELRPDYQPQGVYEIPAAAELGYQFPAPPTWADYQATLSDSQERLLMDYFANGQLNPSLRRSLESMASEVGMTYQELLQQIEQAYYGEQVAVP